MKQFRLGLLIALIALVVLAPLSAKAQGGACPPGLSAQDCELLTASAANTEGYEQFVMESWTFTIKSTGLRALLGGEIDLNVTGDGALDASAVTVDPDDPNSIFNGLKTSITMKAKAALPGQAAQSGDLEVRLVDGVVYVKSSEGTQGAWWKLSTEQALEQSGGLDALGSQLQGMLSNPAAMGGFNFNFEGIEGLITAVGTDGPTIDGMATREITTNIALDVLAKAITGEDLRPILRQALSQAGLGMMFTDEDFGQFSMLVAGFEPTLKASKLSFVQYISKDDKRFRGFALRFTLDVDANQAALLQLPGALKIELVLDVRLAKIGTAPNITAPEGAIDAPDMDN